MLQGINDLPWVQREKRTRQTTLPLLRQLEKNGVWELVKHPTLEEDKSGIDYFIRPLNIPNVSSEEVIPIQFKIRSSPKYQDLIVSRYQPCHGLDQEILPKSNNSSEQTAEGRDWRGLMNSVSVLYFVAAMNKNSEYDTVSFIKSDSLKKHALSVDASWETSEHEGQYLRPKSHYTKDTMDKILAKNPIKNRFCTFRNKIGDEVWYQKNKRESPKFLMYIEKSRRDGHFEINPLELEETKDELVSQGLL